MVNDYLVEKLASDIIAAATYKLACLNPSFEKTAGALSATKEAAVNWNQPFGTYLGGATSGGVLGGLIGSGIGGLKGAISSARAAEAGFGNKLKAVLKGGANGGLRGGLIGTGVGAGLGALQVPYGIGPLANGVRRKLFEDSSEILKQLARPNSSISDIQWLSMPKGARDFITDKILPLGPDGLQKGEVANLLRHSEDSSLVDSVLGSSFKSGLLTPGGTLSGLLGNTRTKPF
jgi:hypothetical protein